MHMNEQVNLGRLYPFSISGANNTPYISNGRFIYSLFSHSYCSIACFLAWMFDTLQCPLFAHTHICMIICAVMPSVCIHFSFLNSNKLYSMSAITIHTGPNGRAKKKRYGANTGHGKNVDIGTAESAPFQFRFFPNCIHQYTI